MRSRTCDVLGLRLAAALVLAHAATSCIVSGDRCGANQVAFDDQVSICLCKPDYVTASDGVGCVPCGENQTAVQNACVCKPGFSRPSASDVCKPEAQTATCTADADCAAATPYCARKGSEPGYCTRTDCTANADCTVGWSCEQTPTTRYCARPPTGFGLPCQSNADCAGFDASYCEVLSTHTCILAGCATRERTCPSEWTCCDYASLIGSPFSICASEVLLGQQGCPMGGMAVKP